MFWNRKQPQPTLCDRELEKRLDAYYDASKALREKARDSYIKSEVLKVHGSNTANGRVAQDRANRAKYLVQCAIGAYDVAKWEYNEYRASTADRRETTQWYNEKTMLACEIIENEIKDLLKGR